MNNVWRNTVPLLLLISTVFLAGHSGAQDIRPATTFRDCPECPEMVVIPRGKFLMGTSIADYERDLPLRPTRSMLFQFLTRLGLVVDKNFAPSEMPQHPVTIQDFAMGKYPVTVSQFVAFVRETGYAPEGNCLLFKRTRARISPSSSWMNTGFDQTPLDPVVCMRVRDARAYIDWLNKKVGSPRGSAPGDLYRLPSESEWEYAARAGTTTARWWGDQIGVGNANCDGCNGTDNPLRPTPVGSFRPNPFGLYDMLGNVWEIVSDCWNTNYDGAPQDGMPWLSGDCSKNVARGGSFSNDPWSARSASRLWQDTNSTDNLAGFRVARSIP
jgi:formylglycine-generating enzyme required for sulfatase activity